MAYELKFVDSPPSLELIVDERAWDSIPAPELRNIRELREYLHGKPIWVSTSEHVGYGRCGKLLRENGRVRATFRVRETSIKRIVLTLNHLLSYLHPFQRQNDWDVIVENAYGRRHDVWGYVSGGFREKLCYLARADTDAIVQSMRAAFRAAVMPGHARYAKECGIAINREERRFMLRCFGDACDLSIPAEEEESGRAEFVSHNLDSSAQQLTLLAGLAVLAERVKAIGT